MPRPEAEKVPKLLHAVTSGEAPVIEAAAGEGDAKIRRFSGTAYTGGAMRPMYFYRPVVLDMRGGRVEAGNRPILRGHDHDKIVGHADKITLAGNKITVEGLISGASEVSREVLETADNGFPWRLSVGASIDRMVSVDEGEKVTVNGKSFTGPLYIVRKWALAEISFVPLAADNRTSAKIAASAAKIGVFSMTFEKWLEAKGFEPDGLGDEQRAVLQAAFDAEQQNEAEEREGDEGIQKDLNAGVQPTGNQVPPSPPRSGTSEEAVAAIRAASASEMERIAAIREVCAGHHEKIEAQAIRDGWDRSRTELAVLRAERATGPAIHATSGQPGAPVLEAALCLAAGIAEEEVARSFDERTINAAMERDNRNTGIQRIIHETLRAAGRYAPYGPMTNATIQAAFEADRSLRASGGFSTISLSGILGNVANKMLRASFLAVDPVSTRVCGMTDANNFHQFTRYQLSMSGDVEEVGQDGELKHVTLSEESYTNQLKTRGGMISLTRQQIINDDLGAFAQIPRLFGRKCALAREKAVFTLLLANTGNFFGSGNSNLLTGTDSALSIAALSTAEQTFLDQKDAVGDPVMITPAMLLVPTALKVTAEQLFKEVNVNETTTANKPKPASNPHAGKFRPECSPYLSSSSLTGYSATAWYLLANPADVPLLELAYLGGQRAPTIESAETDFNTLGMQWRCYWDFGVAQADHRAGVKSTGVSAT